MRAKEILYERIVNLHRYDNKDKYGEEVWNILQKSYEPVGGFKTAVSLEELIEKSGMWKLVVRNGLVTAVKIYRDQFGRKSIASGSDGSRQGKKDVFMMMKDDVKYGRTWAEVSGPVEKLMGKFGATPIPAIYAEYLSKKKILSISTDGYHYTRLIEGEPHEKIMFGVPQLTPKNILELESQGISLNHWPY